ncbi:hypothetical protein [Clostridium uliginosum]|uniref:Uncharacterized protein n=1 Tax=Clostridium uliginosum TaxID=119641 RepID=A0A1I1KT45_9CLOT|nr:hypothetical protein [Clostridium uliginosum]SFC63785.1 hypothetical protein SAMN05421842_106138 [Clostridium uliginosum]
MKTLIIYDNTGNIFLQMGVSYRVPEGGIQYLETEIPEGKLIKNIDISVTPHKPVLEDIPKSQIKLLQEELAQNTKDMAKKDLQMEQLQKDLADLTKQIAGGK